MKKYYIITGILPLIMILGNSMIIPIIPAIEKDLQITSFETGIILSIFSLPAAIIIPFVGLISDIVGPKVVVLFSLVLVMIGSSVTILSGVFSNQPLALIILGRFIQGIGAGGTAPLAMIIIGDLFEGSARSEQLSNIEFFNGIGKVISPIIGTMVATFIWYRAFTVYFFFSIFAFIGVLVVLKNQKITHKQRFSISEYIQSVKKIMRNSLSILLPLMLIGGAGLFILFGLLFFMTYTIEYKYQIEGIFKGISLAIPFVMLAFLSFISGKKVGNNERLMKRNVMIGSILIIVSLLLLSYNQQLQPLLFGVMTVGSGLGLILPSVNILIAKSVGSNERGNVFALYSMVRFLGVAFGPIMFSMWMNDISFMFFRGLLLYFILFLWLFLRMKQHSFLEVEKLVQ